MRHALPATLLLAAAIGAGCAAKAVPIWGRDGNPYQYVQCRGLLRSLEDCYEAAAAACPQGYRIAENVAPREFYNSSLVFSCRTE
jgi:hypothetical protein